jgi:chemotaxis protein MotB
MMRSHALGHADDTDEVPEYWITYSDLMVSLLMVFALLLFLAMARLQAEKKRVADAIAGVQVAIGAAGTVLKASGGSIVVDSVSGTLTMNSELLFSYGSAVLHPEAEQQISRIATVFLQRLLRKPSVDTLLQEIVVEGHTDTVGTYMSNLGLSQQRAYSVLRAMVESTYGMPHAGRLRQLIVASGKSEVMPIRGPNGQIDADRSRRIAIRLRFRDDVMLKQLLETNTDAAFVAPK